MAIEGVAMVAVAAAEAEEVVATAVDLVMEVINSQMSWRNT